MLVRIVLLHVERKWRMMEQIKTCKSFLLIVGYARAYPMTDTEDYCMLLAQEHTECSRLQDEMHH